MRIAYVEITDAITTVIAEQGLPTAAVHLMPTEAPRAWGVTSNVCFMLGKAAAAAEIEQATAGLSKNEAKAAAAEISKRAVSSLAERLALELAKRIGSGELPFVAAIEAEGGYINFYYDQQRLSAYVVQAALSEGERYGGYFVGGDKA